MTTTTQESGDDARRIDLTRTQQWVVHHVMVARRERARSERRTPPWWTRDVIERVEDGTVSFTPFEARRVRRDLEEYARGPGTPPGDVAAARAAAEQLERVAEHRPVDAPE